MNLIAWSCRLCRHIRHFLYEIWPNNIHALLVFIELNRHCLVSQWSLFPSIWSPSTCYKFGARRLWSAFTDTVVLVAVHWIYTRNTKKRHTHLLFTQVASMFWLGLQTNSDLWICLLMISELSKTSLYEDAGGWVFQGESWQRSLNGDHQKEKKCGAKLYEFIRRCMGQKEKEHFDIRTGRRDCVVVSEQDICICKHVCQLHFCVQEITSRKKQMTAGNLVQICQEAISCCDLSSVILNTF